MFLTFEGRVPCVVCGYRLRYVLMDSYRVNKASIRKQGTSPAIGAADRVCPECRTENHAPPPDRYTLLPHSKAEVDAYRAKRWPAKEAA